MAEIVSIGIKRDKITVILNITKQEHVLLGNITRDLILLPTDFKIHLTTGTLGNSNRIMLPNKILSKYNITDFLKRVPAEIFKLDGEAYLLIKLQEPKSEIPVFDDKKGE